MPVNLTPEIQRLPFKPTPGPMEFISWFGIRINGKSAKKLLPINSNELVYILALAVL
jgi:hypothetical protein